jgi:hypothetical protein
MKRPLAECPKPEGIYERDEEGTPVVDCSICDFGKPGESTCSLWRIIDRTCGEEKMEIKYPKLMP